MTAPIKRTSRKKGTAYSPRTRKGSKGSRNKNRKGSPKRRRSRSKRSRHRFRGEDAPDAPTPVRGTPVHPRFEEMHEWKLRHSFQAGVTTHRAYVQFTTNDNKRRYRVNVTMKIQNNTNDMPAEEENLVPLRQIRQIGSLIFDNGSRQVVRPYDIPALAMQGIFRGFFGHDVITVEDLFNMDSTFESLDPDPDEDPTMFR